MPDLPKIHPREAEVNDARYRLQRAITESVRVNNLTYAELFQILSMEIAGWCKFAIRDERESKP